MFYDRYVPLELLKRYDAADLAELEEKLQDNRLSVAMMKNHFLTQILASQLEEKYVPETFEIPPEEILDYYRQNLDKWQSAGALPVAAVDGTV